MSGVTHRVRRIIGAALAAIAVGCLSPVGGGASVPTAGPLAGGSASALAPTAALCSGNSAFCGAVLRIESSTGTIVSVAAGAHYGTAWGIPAKPNDATGIGWCVDDTHTGFPAGPIGERPLPGQWTPNDQRVAAAIIALYGGDRVLPYQPLAIDAAGELAGDASSTRLRHVAVWLALRSVLVDPAGTPRIDLASASAFSDRTGRNPSPIGNAAIPLAESIVDTARRVAAQNGDPVATIEVDPAELRTDVGSTLLLPVRITDPAGRPIPHTPVWPESATNVTVARHPSDDPANVQVNRNAEIAGWPSFDTTRSRTDASVTDMNGVAMFSVRVLFAGAWSATFATETAPTGLALFGDDIRAQNNVALRGGTPTLATATVEGDATLRHIRVVKTTTDAAFSVAGATFALIDAGGTEVGRATTGDDGIIDFVVESGRPEPLRVRELAAPPGLRPATGDIDVAGQGEPVSTDPDSPTTVTVANEPIRFEVTIEKRVLGAPSEPTDLSGFTFVFSRRSTTGSAVLVATVTTDRDGRTPSVYLATADYDVAEVVRPRWWPDGDPLPPPTVVAISSDTPEDPGAPIVFAIDNTFPVPVTTSTTTTTEVPPPPSPPTSPPTSTSPSESTTTTSTTTSTTTPSTNTTVAPPTIEPPPDVPSAAPPTPPPATPPSLPRTGNAPWQIWYRIGSLTVLIGAVLFFASTMGLGLGTGRLRLRIVDPGRSIDDPQPVLKPSGPDTERRSTERS